MGSLLYDLSQHQGGGTLRQLSSQLGAPEDATASAVSMALPVLLGGLASNAQDPRRVHALNQALEEDHDGSLLDDLPAPFGGASGGASAGAVNPKALNGAGILKHILGGRQARVEEGIGRATGLSSSQVGRLLMMLAPLAMAHLGRRKRQEGLDAGGLGGVLQREHQALEQRAPGAGGLLGRLLDRDDDGSVVDDLARLAPGLLGGLLGGRR